jgi:predicted enzyme related to lactoylglutathione lyase
MSKTKTPRGIKATPARREAPNDVPQLFRLNVEVADLEAAISFYSDLFGVQGRKQPGNRCYFDCGPVTLQVLDVSSNGQPHPAAKALYFTVENLEAAFDRAKALIISEVSEVMRQKALEVEEQVDRALEKCFTTKVRNINRTQARAKVATATKPVSVATATKPVVATATVKVAVATATKPAVTAKPVVAASVKPPVMNGNGKPAVATKPVVAAKTVVTARTVMSAKPMKATVPPLVAGRRTARAS